MSISACPSRELPYEKAKWEYEIPFIASLRNRECPQGIIGQPRAMRSLEMGLCIPSENYHIYLSGDEGSGRMSAIRYSVAPLKGNTENLKDIVACYDPENPERIKTLLLPPSQGAVFCRTMKEIAKSRDSGALKQAKQKFPEAKPFFDTLSLSAPEETLRTVLLNPDTSERPLVVEKSPTLSSLFGLMDKKSEYPHLSYRPGALLKASGGFLVIDAELLLEQKEVWSNLKRYLVSLQSNLVRIETSRSVYYPPVIRSLSPRIILVGNDDLYESLSEEDDLFLSLFKISAQFDYTIKADEKNLAAIISLLDRQAEEHNLLPLSDGAVAEILRYGSREAEKQNEITASLSLLLDLETECDYWARKESKTEIDKEVVERTLSEREYALGLSEQKINDEILEGDMLIHLTDSRVGVVNGLAVMDRGTGSFGTPTVITATVAPGSEGIINIEHEAGLSGEIHDKGILILQGYLRKHYATGFPLSIYAGIAFEQNYSEIDGDSASSSELYALLSAIGDLPIRQDIAVTGSVNQLGIIQPVGGINEKISGFYHTCRATGLTSKQGVIIPAANIRNLILPPDVLEAIKKGSFHIYPVSTIDEGMEILTDLPAAQRNRKGRFPSGSYNLEVETRLREMNRAVMSK